MYMPQYNKKLDRLITHDFPGVHSNGMHDFVMDEIELGARVAILISDPEQAWWELIGDNLAKEQGY